MSTDQTNGSSFSTADTMAASRLGSRPFAASGSQPWATDTPTEAPLSATPNASVLSPESDAIEFRVHRAGVSRRRLRLTGNRYTFGNAEGCSIRLSDPTLRPMHAVLIRDSSRVLVRAYSVPLEINGVRTTEASLAVGDVLRIGSYEFELLTGAKTPAFQTPPLLNPHSAVARPAATADETPGHPVSPDQGGVPRPNLPPAEEVIWRERLRREIDQWRERQSECDRRETRIDEREVELRNRESELWTRADNLYRREARLQNQEAETFQLYDEFSNQQQNLLRLREEAAARQDELMRREAQMRDQEFEYRRRLDEATRQLQTSQHQADVAAEAVHRMRDQFEELNEQIERLSQEQQEIETREATQRETHERVRQELEAARNAALEQSQASQSRSQEAESRISELEAQIESLQSDQGEQLQQQREQLEQSNNESLRLRDQVAELQDTVTRATEESAQLRQNYQEAVQSVERLEALVAERTETAETANQTWVAETDQLRGAIDRLTQELSEAHRELDQLRHANETLSQKLDFVETQRDEACEEVESRPSTASFNSLRIELDQAREQLDGLKQQYEEALAELETRRTIDRGDQVPPDHFNATAPEIVGGQESTPEIDLDINDSTLRLEDDDEVWPTYQANQPAVDDSPRDHGSVDDTARTTPGEALTEVDQFGDAESDPESPTAESESSTEEIAIDQPAALDPGTVDDASIPVAWNSLPETDPSSSEDPASDSSSLMEESSAVGSGSASVPTEEPIWNQVAEVTTDAHRDEPTEWQDGLDSSVDDRPTNSESAEWDHVESPETHDASSDSGAPSWQAPAENTDESIEPVWNDSQVSDSPSETAKWGTTPTADAEATSAESESPAWPMTQFDDQSSNEHHQPTPWGSSLTDESEQANETDPNSAAIPEPDDAQSGPNATSPWNPSDESPLEPDPEASNRETSPTREENQPSESAESTDEETGNPLVDGSLASMLIKDLQSEALATDDNAGQTFVMPEGITDPAWDSSRTAAGESSKSYDEYGLDSLSGTSQSWDQEHPEESREAEWSDSSGGDDSTDANRESELDYELGPASGNEGREELSDTSALSESGVIEGPPEESEDSIEAYMNRLLQRVQGDSEEEEAEELGNETASLSTSSPLSTQSGFHPPAQAAQPETMAAEIDPAAPLVPRSQAPELKEDLSAMRDLANASARSAITRSVRMQTRDTQIQGMMRFVYAGIAVVCGAGAYAFMVGVLCYIAVAMTVIIAGIFIHEGVQLFAAARKRLQAAESGEDLGDLDGGAASVDDM